MEETLGACDASARVPSGGQLRRETTTQADSRHRQACQRNHETGHSPEGHARHGAPADDPKALQREDDSGGFRPDDDHVVVAYAGSSVPACSATMYWAYQSGQFASASPMRFSCSPWAAAARRIASARSLAEPNEVTAGSTRPGSRVVTSWNSQLLPSGSLNETNEP